ncbi:hypothetical protein [Paraliomyxa miuraensis]|uniref:hypothetical protein n=1 Tax=Paraliomyxa miuraensis TaxID=376150 RepID=UPI00225AA21F|nr:hypothetical protein [Paraliomyxa miuraensis]MCX4244230.1 hypothetical protein [Paraliomyxa miuraensis]
MSDASQQGLLFGCDGKVVYLPGPGPGREAEPPVARERPTSVVAGRRIRMPAKTYRAQVHDSLRAGPKTDEEICRATGLRGSTVRPRRLELLREGLIEDSGTVRPTQSGREAIVWRCRETAEETGCRSS